MAKSKSQMAKWLRRLVLLVIAGGVVGLIVVALLPKPVGVDLAAVEQGPLRVTVDEDGQTRIKERYVVSTPLSGRLLRIGLDVGDAVQAGETVLARIQPTDPELLDPRAVAQAEARVKAAEARLSQVQAQLEKASVSYDFAEAEFARADQLADRGAVTPSELEEKRLAMNAAQQDVEAARFAINIARFELELEQAALVRTQGTADRSDSEGEGDAAADDNGSGQFLIRAPISGRVLKLVQESATIATPGLELVEIGDPLDLEVVVDVLSSDAVRIEPGATALLEQWGGAEPLTARVRLVEPSGFTKFSALGVEEQRVNVILDLVDPPDERSSLGDGFRVEARIVVWEEPDVLKVPTSSLFRNEGEWAVFVVDDGQAKQRTIQIGRQNDLEAQVLSGLEVGARIVTHPGDKLADGVQVFVR
jgi:HlyD family secretion protein